MAKHNWFFILCGICVIAFVIQLAVPGFTELFLLDSSAFVQPWRFVTAIFLHGGITHLLYNMFALFFFGLVLERTIGSKRFLLVFFITGILANVVSIWFYDASLGASGAIFGVIGGLIVLRPGMTVFAFGLPMPLFIAGIAWGVGDVIGTFNPSSSIATLAHLSGMGFGLVFGALFRDWRAPPVRHNNVRFDEDSVRRWEDAHMR